MEKTKKQIDREDETKKIVQETTEHYERLKQERRAIENGWELNINFMIGNQFAFVDGNGELQTSEKSYGWQQREVFNHLAPIVESRLARLSKIRPTMTVVPASSEDKDIYSARLGRNILSSLAHRVNLSKLVASATKWSEICGTSFYKIFWNENLGDTIAYESDEKKSQKKSLKTGDVDVCVVPPFEIFPEVLAEPELENQPCIIHARAMHVSQIKSLYGIEVNGQDISTIGLEKSSDFGGLGYYGTVDKTARTVRKNHAVVIEKYEKPTADLSNGQLTIVCDEHLIYQGELPFANKKDGQRGYPFIRQVSAEQPCSFFGQSIVERCIPIQRAYNAVKNRKHEFLNRLAMGVYAVEDGSVDTEELQLEGLPPGKVVVYRQGSIPPRLLDAGTVPNDLNAEETRLLQEFMHVSGVSDMMRNNQVATSNLSGVAIQLLIEQDDSRLLVSSDQIRFCLLEIGRHTLSLYRQFASWPRLLRVANGNEVEMHYFESADISSDDVVFETESEIGQSLATRRNMVMELIGAGLLNNEDGKMDMRMRARALDLLGFGLWEAAHDSAGLHIKKADKENFMIDENEQVQVGEFDNHDLHIDQHINHLVSLELSTNQNSRAINNIKKHIKEHKQYMALMQQIQELPKV